MLRHEATPAVPHLLRLRAGVPDGARATAGRIARCPLDEGAPDCTRNTQPPLQVHRYNTSTYVLRQHPCATYEAPFLYLLVGRNRALLIDSGAVADARAMPLADTVMGRCPTSAAPNCR